jgi:hypothetical protein
MKNLSQEDVGHLSFPDARVLAFVLENDIKRLLIRLDSAFVDTPGPGRRLQETTLRFFDLDILAALEFRDSAFSPIDLAVSKTTLRDICEFSLNNGMAHLRGFSRHSGLWTELIMRYGRVEARTADASGHQDGGASD